jgi:GNAT superfamily N-acetyltransferase
MTSAGIPQPSVGKPRAIYRNRAVTVRVDENRGSAITFNGTGTDIGYHGRLDYSVDDANSIITIDTVEAQPERQGLGAVLLLELAIIAPRYRVTTIEAHNVARTAIAFYKDMGFVPDPTQLQNVQAVIGHANAAEHVSTWRANRNLVQLKAGHKVRNKGWSF